MTQSKIPDTNWLKLPKPADEHEPFLALFRKRFKLESVPSDLKIRISADSRYKLYVNGSFVEKGPAKGDNLVWYADEVELSPVLQEGDNVIAVEVLRYPIDHGTGNYGTWRTDKAGLYVAENVECAKDLGPNPQSKHDFRPVSAQDGIGISADISWKCTLEPEFTIVSESKGFAPLRILENRVGCASLARWKNVDFNDEGWANAQAYNFMEIQLAVSPGNLLPRPIPYMNKIPRAFADFKTFNVGAHEQKTVVFNAGELMCGYLSLRLTGGRGATVRILCSEGYVQPEVEDPDKAGQLGRLPIKKDRLDSVNGHLAGYTDTYTVGGVGTPSVPETYEPFWFRTFRFVQLEIETADEPVSVVGFDYTETGYPLEIKTKVTTSDPSLSAIWDISARSLKRCMHETYFDCPFYEQLQYAMDSRSQILYTYATAYDDRLARQCMDAFKRSQRYDGMINCCYPDFEPNVIPGFAIYYILMLYDHMMYFGDKKFLRGHLGAIDGVLEFFNSNLTSEGLVGKVGGLNTVSRYWSFIDWTTQWTKTTGVPAATMFGPITMESLLYVYGLISAAAVLDFMERFDTADEYRARAKAVKDAVRKYCINEDGLITDGPIGVYETGKAPAEVAAVSVHCQVFGVLTGVLDKQRGRDNLLETIHNKERYAQCSVAMAFYLFRALEQTDLYEETDRLWDTWRDMLEKHLTTCVENNTDERSDCHAWGALALYELPSVILGVRPAAPGYAEMEVVPHPGKLTHAEGEVATGKGIVKVSWQKKEDGKIDLQVQAAQ